MRRIGWLNRGLGLALTLALAPCAIGTAAAAEGTAPAAAAPKVETLGSGPAYDTLGGLPVLHHGRIKPFDTMARQTIKAIFGKESITFRDAESRPVAVWGHNGAYLDIMARPEAWDDRPIIRVDHLPLKALILAAPVKRDLTAIAAKPTTSAEDRKRLEGLAASASISLEQLLDALRASKLPKDDGAALLAWANRLGASERWVSPKELETARISVDGKPVSFEMYVADVASRVGPSDLPLATRQKATELERRAMDAATALRHYQAVRGDRVGGDTDLFVSRPANATYLKFIADIQQKETRSAHGQAAGGGGMTPLEQDANAAFGEFLEVTKRQDWHLPGTDKEFDARLIAFLREKAGWLSLRTIMEAHDDELTRAGFPTEAMSAFRNAYKELVAAEDDAPGRVAEARTAAFVSAARTLGEAVGGYPAPVEMARETHFNRFAPFYKAIFGYGWGLVLLLLSLGITADRATLIGKGRLALYYAGMAAFAAGILLEAYGFYYRVRISGWAPVTNMYETVIWVALVIAVIGFLHEMVSKRTYTALAATGLAFVTSVLAYQVSLLDPNIKTIPPVLRDNYWLTIHVLTEVSSYGAFALAMGLALMATVLYITATYRRSVPYAELARPLVLGLPLLGLGGLGLASGYGMLSVRSSLVTSAPAFAVAALAAIAGMMLTITGVGALAGEAISRVRLARRLRLAGGSMPSGDEAAEPSDDGEPANGQGSAFAPAATSVQTVTVNEGSAAVATLSRPSIAEIRARAAASRPALDARGQMIQETAAQLKALSGFIYNAIKIGVLLITAGTFLGGLWADVSWGRFWGWDPKEVWALITLLLYLVPLHGRFAGWINTFGLVACSVWCFASVVMAWYGVNFVLGVGLHSYGFTEGGGQGVVTTVCLAVGALVFAAAWRRSLANVKTA